MYEQRERSSAYTSCCTLLASSWTTPSRIDIDRHEVVTSRSEGAKLLDRVDQRSMSMRAMSRRPTRPDVSAYMATDASMPPYHRTGCDKLCIHYVPTFESYHWRQQPEKWSPVTWYRLVQVWDFGMRRRSIYDFPTHLQITKVSVLVFGQRIVQPAVIGQSKAG